eukprot:gnl/MRDRNA2_/MRDRNA2_44364_c0_seq2.p1 gnl/MRDRNA2_/MRDRNA2_44364_c0~~gnl/MRDRNA2_/MRDRNA2_44364_c0_seq2.p1  ORF type:complete len:515 (+),score=103.68 gnl/MRDRNA2_/MRDRNA2_44364_c0_seq2:124-1668(+)
MPFKQDDSNEGPTAQSFDLESYKHEKEQEREEEEHRKATVHIAEESRKQEEEQQRIEEEKEEEEQKRKHESELSLKIFLAEPDPPGSCHLAASKIKMMGEAAEKAGTRHSARITSEYHSMNTTANEIYSTLVSKEVDNKGCSADFYNHVKNYISYLNLLDAIESDEIITQSDLNHLEQCCSHSSDQREVEEEGSEYILPQAWAGPLWKDHMPIKYCYDNSADLDLRNLVQEAMAQTMQQVPCISFEQINFDTRASKCVDGNSVMITMGDSCGTMLGMLGMGENNASKFLKFTKKCAVLGSILHEIGHLLGMIHEHSRPDRDEHLNILLENVKDNWIPQFDIRPEAYTGTTYDVLSIMHYHGWAHSKNGAITVETKVQELQQYIGQRVGFSELDIQQLGLMYGCPDTVAPFDENANLSASLLKGRNLPTYTGECKDVDYTSSFTLKNGLGYVLGCHNVLCKAPQTRSACPVSCGLCDPDTHPYISAYCIADPFRCNASPLSMAYILLSVVGFFFL